MQTIRPRHFLLALIPLLTVGCGTSISHRITEKSAVFNSLTPKEKSNLENGIIAPGYSPDMAYIALGKPSKIESKDTAEGKAIVWTYHNYYPTGKLEDLLTAYSRSRNPNLQRSLNLQSGAVTVNPNAPGSSPGLGATSTGQGNPLSLPDLPVYKLYIIFLEDKVVDFKLESMDGTVL